MFTHASSVDNLRSTEVSDPILNNSGGEMIWSTLEQTQSWLDAYNSIADYLKPQEQGTS